MEALKNYDTEHNYAMYILNDDGRKKPIEPTITETGYKILILGFDIPKTTKKFKEMLSFFNKYSALNRWSQKESAYKLTQCCDGQYRQFIYELCQKYPKNAEEYDALRNSLYQFTRYYIKIRDSKQNKSFAQILDMFMERYDGNNVYDSVEANMLRTKMKFSENQILTIDDDKEVLKEQCEELTLELEKVKLQMVNLVKEVDHLTRLTARKRSTKHLTPTCKVFTPRKHTRK